MKNNHNNYHQRLFFLFNNDIDIVESRKIMKLIRIFIYFNFELQFNFLNKIHSNLRIKK